LSDELLRRHGKNPTRRHGKGFWCIVRG
jgi:hypothetical protein